MIELIIGLGVGIVIGMYVVGQIQNHIENRTQNKDLLDNMKKYDTSYNDGNFTYYYTHKKREKK